MEITVQKESFNDTLDFHLREAFPGQHSVYDSFNISSEYIVIYCQQEIAAMGRLSPCPNGVFFTRTNASPNFSNTSDTIDLGRCLVVNKFRGSIYYDFLISYCLMYAYHQGYKFVNGAALTGRKMVDRLITYGFTKIGEPVILQGPIGSEGLVQAYTANLDETVNVWKKIFEDCQRQFQAQGYNLVDKNQQQRLFS